MAKKRGRKPKQNVHLLDLRAEPQTRNCKSKRNSVVAYKDGILSEVIINQITSYIGIGGHPEIAANASGVSTATFRRWLTRGSAAIDSDSQDPAELLYATLVQRVLIAAAKAELRYLTHVYDASKRDWKASQYVLGTRFRERWGGEERLSRVVIQGDPVNPIEHVHTAGFVPVDVSTLSLADCKALMAQISPPPETLSSASAGEVIDVTPLESRTIPPVDQPAPLASPENDREAAREE